MLGMGTGRRKLAFIILGSLSVFLTAAAHAGQSPVGFSKAFLPDTIGPGSASRLEFTIQNNTGAPVGELAFSDTLPMGLDIANPAGATNGCGGVLSAPDGGATISLSGGGLGIGASCVIGVNVTSDAPNAYLNTSGPLTSGEISFGSASATLTVSGARPGFRKEFSPATIPPGGVSTLTFTVENGGPAIFSLSFNDNLPSGMIIATPANAFTDCQNPSIPATLTASPGTSAISLMAFGSAPSFPVLPAESVCTVTVDVTTVSPGLFVNASGELMSGSPSVSSGFAVDALNVPLQTLNKVFVDDPVAPGGSVTLEFTIVNLDRTEPATDIAFTDDLDAALSGLTLTSVLFNDCGGTVMGVGGGTLDFSGGSLPAGGACTLRVQLQVPAGASSGGYTNTTGPITFTRAGQAVVGNMATDTLVVAPIPLLTKSFLDAGTLSPDPVVGAGEDVVIRFTIANTSADFSAVDVTFTDELSTFLPTPLVVTLPPTPDPPCGAGSSLTVVALGVGGQGLLLDNGVLDAGASCQFDVTVTIPAGFPAGVYLNRTSAVSANVGEAPVQGLPASDDLVVVAPPSLSKEFTDDPVNPNGTVTLRFTLTHDEFAPGAATDITFTDDLAATLSGLAGDGMTVNDVCGAGNGTIGWSAGNTLLTFSGGTLQPGEQCVFSVTLNVPGSAPVGGHPNTTSAVTATVSGASAVGNPATDTLRIAGLVLTKEFTNDPVIPGGTVNLRFTIENISSASDASNILFLDNLDATLSGLAAPGPLSTGTCDGSLSGTTFLIYSGGSLMAGQSCFFDVTLDVPAGAANGTYLNITQSFSATFVESTVLLDNASDGLVVDDALLSLTKEFTDDPVAPGGTVTLDFNLTNLSATQAASGIAFTDDLDAALSGLVATGALFNDCGGMATSMFPTGVFGYAGGSLGAGASCRISLSVDVPAAATPGLYPNTTSEATGTIGGLAVTGGPASDALEVINTLDFSKSFDGPTTAGGAPTLTFTISNPGTDTATGLAFSDDLDAVISGLVATNLPLSDVCGSGSLLAGTSSLSLTGGELGPMSSCTFDVELSVPGGAAAGMFPNTTSMLFQSGVAVSAPATASLTVEPPPTFSKMFAPDTIVAGGVSTLTFTVDNSASVLAAGNLSFIDNFPAGVVIANPTNASTTCAGGMGDASPGAGSISFAGGSVGAGAMCTVQLDVTSGAASVYVNTTGDLTSSSGNSGTASDTLTVTAPPPPLFSKSFAPDTIEAGAVSTLTFTIDNTAALVAAGGLSFVDNLPTGVVIADPTNASTTCSGGMGNATAGAGSFSFAGGSVGAGASCTVQFDVTSDSADSYLNTTGDLTSSSGNSGTASDTLTVTAPPPPAFSKSFDGPTTAAGTPVLTFTISNPALVPLTNLSFSDDLDAVISGLVATNTPLSDVCGMGSTLSGTSLLELSGGSVAPESSCTIVVDLLVPAGAAPGTYPNTTSNLFQFSEVTVADPATAELTVEPPPTFSKVFAADTIVAGGVSTLTFTIDNSASAVAAGNLAFADTFPAGVVIADPTNASTTCAGGMGDATAGAGSFSFSGGSVGAGASCTVQLDVTGGAAGSYLNTTGDLTSSSGNSGTASDTLTVVEPPLFSKQFVPDTITPGGVSKLTLTIDNSGNVIAIGNLSVTDNLPAGVTLATPANASTTCMGGTLSAPDGGSAVGYSGGTVAAGSTCTITADVTSDQIDATFTNTTGDLTSDAGNSGSATDDLFLSSVPAPLFSKQFSPTLIVPGALATLTLTIDNNANVVPVGGLSVTDNLPAGLVLATPANASTTCMGGTLTAPNGGTSLSYSGGTAPAAAVCTITVEVTSFSPGSLLTNTTGDLTSDAGNSGPASDQIEVLAPPVLVKSFTDDPLRPGDLGTLRFMLSNPDPARSLFNVEFQDDLEAVLPGLTAFDVGGGVDGRGDPLPRTDPCGSGSQLLGGSVVSLTGASLPPGGSCTFVVRIRIPDGAAAGSYPNATSAVDGDLGEFPVSGNPATDTLIVAPPAGVLDLLKSTSTPQVVSGQMATFNISLRNNGSVTLGSVSVSDPLSPACSRAVADLAPGATFGYTCQSGPLTADLTNEATATATPAGGEPVSVSDTAFVEVVPASISIEKTALTPQVDEGQSATFMITITNLTENVLTGLAVEDLATPDCARAPGALDDLGAMASVSYLCATGELFADLTNTATVTADGGLRASDSATVTVVNTIDFTKVPVEQQIDAGDRAEFTITIRNNSGEARTNLTVSDPLSPECDRVIPSLGAGAEFSYVCGRNSVFNSFVNTATLTLEIGGQTATRVASATVTVRDADIAISKVAVSSVIVQGERAVFTITINNVSDSVKTNLQVSDPLTPDCDRTPVQLGDLPIGGTISYMCQTEPLFANLTNVVTVTATIGSSPAAAGATAAVAAPQGPGVTVTAMATAQVTVVQSPIEIVKTPDATQVNPGDAVQFTIAITNLGGQDISNIVVSDPATPACDATLTGVILAPGASTSYTCMTGALNADLVNTATVTGQLPTGDPVTDSDTATVRVGIPVVGLEAIPTLSEVGLMVLFCLLAGAGLWMMKRREETGAE